MSNNQNNPIQTCICGCFVFDAECKKCVNCGAYREENNPQEVPQVKSVEEILLDELSDHHVKYLDSLPFFKDWVLQAMEIYAQSRIAELEAERDKYREALEAVRSKKPFGNNISPNIHYERGYDSALFDCKIIINQVLKQRTDDNINP